MDGDQEQVPSLGRKAPSKAIFSGAALHMHGVYSNILLCLYLTSLGGRMRKSTRLKEVDIGGNLTEYITEAYYDVIVLTCLPN